jgi:hypothetical protein
VEDWGNISQQEQANLVQSMRRRCTAVINAPGGHTRYRLTFDFVHQIQFMSVVESYFNTNIYTFAENKHS